MSYSVLCVLGKISQLKVNSIQSNTVRPPVAPNETLPMKEFNVLLHEIFM